ncbi:MAG: TonB C-terminal domain-containing protein [Burkholderiales bacterium]|nr:TonB C-terminal domain-containing protein [Burkholderiales bacterium]
MIAPAADHYRFQSGALALLVHAAFFALLIFGITWQAKEPAGVVVDLWSNLPTPEAKPAIKPVEPPPPAPEPIKKVAPKPAPPAPVKTPDIALKEKRVQEEKRKQEQMKQEQLKKEQLKQEQTRLAEQARQQQAQADLARRAQAQQSAAQQSIVNDYTGRIQSKIQSKLNKALCGDGKPQLEFDIALLPTGQLRGNPILRKGSGLAACDKAVENAILQSDPLPVPPQPEAFSFFRELHLKFRPNE